MSESNERIRITRLQLTNFKGFSRFSLKLEPMTMLVGPNNAGKSTIVGAFRALSVALRTARTRTPMTLRLADGNHRGYRIPTEQIPISLENAQHNYSEEDAVATFTLSNGNQLRLIFSSDAGCQLVTLPKGPIIRSTAEFKRQYPIDISVVPVLGPLEHDEQVVEDKTVQRNLQTHRASRNFRNYWRASSIEDFEEFRQAIRDSWEGIDIQRPEMTIRVDGPSVLHMMCTEDRMTRELYWMGFGFHIWLQIMTHVLRARDATILVMDEPETYMHPALQRYPLSFLRETGVDCLLATHSSELVAEAERSEVALIDKTQRSGKWLRSTAHSDALDALGSKFNFALTDVLRQRTGLLLEGDTDIRLLKQLGRRLSPSVFVGTHVPPVIPLGGHDPDKATYIARAMKALMGPDIRLAVVLDRDYRSDEELKQIEKLLEKEFSIARVLRRKEIENYFLTPDALSKAITSKGEGSDGRSPVDARAVANAVSESMRTNTEGLCVSQYVSFGGRERPSVDASTLTREAMERFRTQWETLEGRLILVSGKEFLRRLNGALQDKGEKPITIAQLASQMSDSEIPVEMATLLRQIAQLTDV